MSTAAVPATPADKGTAAHKVFELCMLTGYKASKFLNQVIDTASTRTHAPFSPSAADRWIQCTASVKHIEKHAKFGEQPGTLVKVDSEMVEAVQTAMDYVGEIVTTSRQLHTFLIEAEVTIPGTQDKGHLDLAAYNNKTHMLHVFDYKNGKKPVDAKENAQMMLYATGLLKQFPKVKRVVLHIMQPNSKTIKRRFSSWEVSLDELDLFTFYVKSKVREANSKWAKFVVSDKCFFCEKMKCDAYLDSKSTQVHEDFIEEFQ